MVATKGAFSSEPPRDAFVDHPPEISGVALGGAVNLGHNSICKNLCQVLVPQAWKQPDCELQGMVK
jgi:hypothetical protein